MESCRLCLQSDVKMYRMVSTAQRKFIEQIFKQHGFYNGLNSEDYACYMCMALLHKSYKFIQLTLDAQKVLCDPLYCEHEIEFPVLKPTTHLGFEYFHDDFPPLNCSSDNVSSETVYDTQIIDSVEELDTSNVKAEDYSAVQVKFENINYCDMLDDKCSIVKIPEELAERCIKNTETSNTFQNKRKTRNRKKLKDHNKKEVIFEMIPETVNIEVADYVVKEKSVAVRKSNRTTSKNLQIVKKWRKIKKLTDNRKFPMECELCDQQVANKTEHYRHYLFEHPNATYPYGYERALCPMCGISVSDKHLTRHIQTHGDRNFNCHICPKKFTSKQILLRHIRITHSEPKLICDYCCKLFKTRVDIVRHIRIHTGEKPFKCHICDAAFAHSGNRAIHIRSSHQNIKIVPKSNRKKERCFKEEKKWEK